MLTGTNSEFSLENEVLCRFFGQNRGSISAVSLRPLPNLARSCHVRLWWLGWVLCRFFGQNRGSISAVSLRPLPNLARSCHVRLWWLGWATVGIFFFRSFAAAVAGLPEWVVALVRVGLFPRFCCGHCHIYVSGLWLWAVWEYFRDFVTAVAVWRRHAWEDFRRIMWALAGCLHGVVLYCVKIYGRSQRFRCVAAFARSCWVVAWFPRQWLRCHRPPSRLIPFISILVHCPSNWNHIDIQPLLTYATLSFRCNFDAYLSKPSKRRVRFIYLSQFFLFWTYLHHPANKFTWTNSLHHACINIFEPFRYSCGARLFGGGNRCATGYYYIFYRVYHLFVYSLGWKRAHVASSLGYKVRVDGTITPKVRWESWVSIQQWFLMLERGQLSDRSLSSVAIAMPPEVRSSSEFLSVFLRWRRIIISMTNTLYIWTQRCMVFFLSMVLHAYHVYFILCLWPRCILDRGNGFLCLVI